MQNYTKLLGQGYSAPAARAWSKLPKSQRLINPSVELAQNAGLIPPDMEIYQPFNVVVRLPSNAKREFVMHHTEQSAIDVYKAVAKEMGVENVSLKTKQGRELSEHTYLQLWNGRHYLKFYATPSDALSWDRRPQVPPRDMLAQLQKNVVDAIVRTGDFTMDGAKMAAAKVVQNVDDSISEALDMSPDDLFHRICNAAEMAMDRVKQLFGSATVSVQIVEQQLQNSIATLFDREPQVLPSEQPRDADAPLGLALQDPTSHIGFRPGQGSYPRCCDIVVHKRLTAENELIKPPSVLEPGDCLVVKWKRFDIKKEKSRFSAGWRNNLARKISGGSMSGPDVHGTTLACLDWRVVGGRNWVNLVAERRSRVIDQGRPYGPSFVIPAQEGEYAIRIYTMFAGDWEFAGERVFKLATHVTMSVGEGSSPYLEMSKVSKYVNQTQDSFLVSPIALQANQHFAPSATYVISTSLWKNSSEFRQPPARGGPPQLEHVYTTRDIDATEGIREGRETDHSDYVWYATRLQESAQVIQALLGTVQLYENRIPDDSRFWDVLPQALKDRVQQTHGLLAPAEPLGGRAASSSVVAVRKGSDFPNTLEALAFRYVRDAASLVDRHVRFVHRPKRDMRSLGEHILFDDKCRVYFPLAAAADQSQLAHLVALQIVLTRGRWSSTIYQTDVNYFFLLGLLAYNGGKVVNPATYNDEPGAADVEGGRGARKPSDPSTYDEVLRAFEVTIEKNFPVYDVSFNDFMVARNRVGALPLSLRTVQGVFENRKLPAAFPLWVHYRALLVHSDSQKTARIYRRFKDQKLTELLPIIEDPHRMVLDMQFGYANPWDNAFLVPKVPESTDETARTIRLSDSKVYKVLFRYQPKLQIHHQSVWYKIK